MPEALELLIGPGRARVVSPDGAAIVDAIRGIEGQADGWVTLSWGVVNYITAWIGEDGDFMLDTEIGNRDSHHRMVGDPLSLEAIIDIFMLFGRGDTDWVEGYQWHRVGLAEVDFRRAPATIQGFGPG